MNRCRSRSVKPQQLAASYARIQNHSTSVFNYLYYRAAAPDTTYARSTNRQDQSQHRAFSGHPERLADQPFLPELRLPETLPLDQLSPKRTQIVGRFFRLRTVFSLFEQRRPGETPESSIFRGSLPQFSSHRQATIQSPDESSFSDQSSAPSRSASSALQPTESVEPHPLSQNPGPDD